MYACTRQRSLPATRKKADLANQQHIMAGRAASAELFRQPLGSLFDETPHYMADSDGDATSAGNDP